MNEKSTFFKYIKSVKVYKMYKYNTYIKSVAYMNKNNTVEVPFGNWVNKLSDIENVVFFDIGFTQRVADKAKEVNPNIKIFLFLWNTIDANNKELLKIKNVYKIFTFNKEDADKYKLNYTKQFYYKSPRIRNRRIKYDTCFLGRLKDRGDILEGVFNMLKKYNITANVKVIEDEKDFISYNCYLKMIMSSKCILDIVTNDNMGGLTLRGLESVFLNKKLITNNKRVVDYSFYNPNNIFIIGEDDNSKLREFIDGEYEQIATGIIDEYSFETWIDNFK